MEHHGREIVNPFYIYPWPVAPEDMGKLRDAKEQLGIRYQVQPMEATPGCNGRVLALREPPNFLCDFFLLSLSRDALPAVEWTLTSKQDSRSVTILQMLEQLMPGIKEVDPRRVAIEEISSRLNLEDNWKPRPVYK